MLSSCDRAQQSHRSRLAWVIEIGGPHGVAEGIIKMADRDLEAMGRLARARTCEAFEWQSIVDRMVEVYRQLVATEMTAGGHASAKEKDATNGG